MARLLSVALVIASVAPVVASIAPVIASIAPVIASIAPVICEHRTRHCEHREAISTSQNLTALSLIATDDDKEYDEYFTPEMLSRINHALEQVAQGKVTKAMNKEELKKFLDKL